jgi:O-acetyl-ADP-ribose deacetylase (regulator of RNase III)
MEKTVNQGRIHLVMGDITEMKVDVIVNAANQNLVLGGGVAGAIAEKGGPVIQEECDRIGGAQVGSAVITNAGNLPAKKVIHAVGPRMGDGNSDEKLRHATMNCLVLAEEYKFASIAFPAISTGIFGYPVDRCARIMLSVAIGFLGKPSLISDIYFCLWNYEIFKAFETILDEKA